MVNESLTAELERYKERVAIFEQRQNVDLNKPQWIQPTLYDGSVIAKEHAVISMFDDEETLILKEESRSKMLDKQNYTISIEKKIKISPIDYSKLNKIKEDFDKRFVTQKELPAEQAFWLKHLTFSETPVTSHTPVRIEAPSELSKVSLVNESLKKIKYQLANFDNVVKKRTTSNAITASVWGFEHTKACFVTEIIPFLKVLKDTFNAFDRTLLDEITKVQTIFNQMEAVVDQCFGDKNAFAIQIKQLRIDNDQFLKQIIGKDSVENVKKDIDEIETINIKLEHSVAKLLSKNENLRKEQEHLKSIYKDQFDSIRKIRVQSKEHCDSLIAQINAKSVENSDLNAQLQEKLAIEPISHRLKNNRDAHEVYIKKTIENTDTLRGFVERARTQNPSEPLLESACMFTKHVQELLVYVSQTCLNSPKPSEKLVVVTPMNKDKRVRFAEPITSSSNIPKQTDSLKTKDSNKPLLTSTGVKPTTSTSGSKPSGNTNNNRIT
ncbi:hypothetical protein Tco_0027063 [Tanacetum coccineum]